METPAATDGFSIYKIGNKVTFAWTYTDLIISPTAVNVVASCSAAATDFTIATKLPIKSMSVTWDTGKFQQTGDVRLPVYVHMGSFARLRILTASLAVQLTPCTSSIVRDPKRIRLK
jgi:hypothetical protein